MFSVYGAGGFVGAEFMKLLGDVALPVPRNSLDCPAADQILYLISTTDNYNVLTNPYIDIETNLTHLVRVMEACKHTGAVFNFVSSWFVYGDQDKLPVTEDSPCNPKGFYSITKKCAEDLVVSYCKTYDMDYRIFRLGNVYGRGDAGVSSKKNAMQYLIGEMKKNKDINLYFGGQFYRDYIHVEDVSRALLFLMEHSPVNDIYNVGGGDTRLFADIMKEAAVLLGSESVFNTVDPPSFHKIVQTKDMDLDSSKLIELGFKYKHNIMESLGDSIL